MTKIGDKLRYNIKDYLSDREVEKLMDLFEKIKLDLSDDGFPTRTNRLEAVENMKRVLEIHNYEISEYNPNTQTEGGQ
jgi:predicted house-cleaning noncanonical NTP pyrophosphatase (MazG superfamily)